MKTKHQTVSQKRRLFSELPEGVQAMRSHREGRITLRADRAEPVSLYRPSAPRSPSPGNRLTIPSPHPLS